MGAGLFLYWQVFLLDFFYFRFFRFYTFGKYANGTFVVFVHFYLFFIFNNFNMLYHIFFLEDDLDRHTMIENNVLVPMVNRLEENEKREQQ